jgi:hypothetical protein
VLLHFTLFEKRRQKKLLRRLQEERTTFLNYTVFKKKKLYEGANLAAVVRVNPSLLAYWLIPILTIVFIGYISVESGKKDVKGFGVFIRCFHFKRGRARPLPATVSRYRAHVFGTPPPPKGAKGNALCPLKIPHLSKNIAHP